MPTTEVVLIEFSFSHLELKTRFCSGPFLRTPVKKLCFTLFVEYGNSVFEKSQMSASEPHYEPQFEKCLTIRE